MRSATRGKHPVRTTLSLHSFLTGWCCTSQLDAAQWCHWRTRDCGLARLLPNGTLSGDRCGKEIKAWGGDPTGILHKLEDHIRDDHRPDFQQVEGRSTPSCVCTWVKNNGKLCGTTIQCSPTEGPYYALAQHIVKGIDHFGLWVSYCECHGQKFASRDSKERHEKNHALRSVVSS